MNNTHYIAALAGAGTGKTYSLVENYLCALFGFDSTRQKKRPQEILALTFTQKAANEMRLRIAKRLSDLQRGCDPHDPLMVQASFYDQPWPSNDELRRISRALANAPIATFHGFCSSLLHREACTLGIDDGFAILSPRDEIVVARNVLRPLIVAELQKPSPMRSLVARFRLGNGSTSLGLIDGLWDVYTDLIEQGISCDELESITAKKPITKSAIEGAINEVSGALQVFFESKSTPSTQRKLLAIKEALSSFAASLEFERETHLAREYERLRCAMKGNFGDKETRTVLLANTIKLGAMLVDYFVAHDERAVALVLHRFHTEFVRVKMQNRWFSYGDLLVKTKEALTNNSALRRRLKQSIAHVLIDEYQDTSPIQEDIVSLLVESKLSEREIKGTPVINAVDFAQGATMFVVGDKKQSIYGFRGADARLFDRMVNKMTQSADNARPFSKRLLTINRRSRRRIIELVNVVAKHSLHTQGYHSDHALEPLPTLHEGACALWLVNGPEEDNTSQNLGGAARGIAELLRTRPDLSLNDIVVLVRRIRSARVIKEKLATVGINARIVGGDGFFQQQEVVDLICALKLAVNPGHEFASMVVLRSPMVLITDEELLKTAHDHAPTFLAAHEQAMRGEFSHESQKRVITFSEILEQVASLIAKNDLAQAMDVLLEKTDYAYALGFEQNARLAWANATKLRVLLAKNTRNPYAAIDDFFERIFEDRKEPLAEGQGISDAVTLMTIHQSKGLEFKVVVLADGESPLPVNHGDFLANDTLGMVVRPRNRAIAACAPDSVERVHAQTRYDRIRDERMEREKEELARLLYVALTRARDELYVVCSQSSFEKPKRTTLVGMFVSAVQAHASAGALCDNVHVPNHYAGPNYDNNDDTAVLTNAFVQIESETRIFASALTVHEPDAFSRFIGPAVKGRTVMVDGNLAHQLIAAVGAEIIYQGHLDNVKNWLNAAFRAGGFALDQFTNNTLEAVTITLAQLLPLARNALVTFEKPLFCWPNSMTMIEGFADLVIEHQDYVLVIEFKSSVEQVQNPNTFFQVLAYAHALDSVESKPTKFAVVRIGARDIRVHDYDEKAREIFLDAVARYRR